MPRENVYQQNNIGQVFCEDTSSNECNKGFNSLDILDVQKSWQERNAGIFKLSYSL